MYAAICHIIIYVGELTVLLRSQLANCTGVGGRPTSVALWKPVIRYRSEYLMACIRWRRAMPGDVHIASLFIHPWVALFMILVEFYWKNAMGSMENGLGQMPWAPW